LASGAITAADEVRGVAQLRIAQLLRRHDRHGDFGEIVADQIVDLAVAHELAAAVSVSPQKPNGSRCGQVFAMSVTSSCG
jgi:hypothetical protein